MLVGGRVPGDKQLLVFVCQEWGDIKPTIGLVLVKGAMTCRIGAPVELDKVALGSLGAF